MGMSGLPGMYVHPKPKGVHIRQTTSAHVITVMCHGPPTGKH